MSEDSPTRVLIVDDEESLRDIVSRSLARLGYECVSASNGAEALEKLHAKTYDLLMTDLKMPVMDGLTLIEKLRRAYPDLPVIIMTAYADVDSARRALRLGASDYLVKPFESLHELRSAVVRTLEGTRRPNPSAVVGEFEKRVRKFAREERRLSDMLDCARIEIESLTDCVDHFQTVASRRLKNLGMLIESLGDGMMVTDTAGTVLAMNNELRQQLLMPHFSANGLTIDRLPGESALRHAILESLQLAQEDSSEPALVETADGSGSPCTYEVRSASIPRDEDERAMLTVVRRLRARTLRKANECA